MPLTLSRNDSVLVERLDLKPLNVKGTGPKRVEVNSLHLSVVSFSEQKRGSTAWTRLRSERQTLRMGESIPTLDSFVVTPEMKLPNAHLAVVPQKKIIGYLLNPAHPVGGSKAAFFMRFGFTVEEWSRLAEALLQEARENDVGVSEQTRHGMRYVVDRHVKTSAGASLNVRTAWFIDSAGGVPRFVTAHPLPRS
ncbi:MAG: hypothetical protein EXS37_18335 [Opitutus sp.]|nr:hypothetical protein [Opitutus sp.]